MAKDVEDNARESWTAASDAEILLILAVLFAGCTENKDRGIFSLISFILVTLLLMLPSSQDLYASEDKRTDVCISVALINGYSHLEFSFTQVK